MRKHIFQQQGIMKTAQEAIPDEEVAFARLAGVVECPGWAHWEREPKFCCQLCKGEGWLPTDLLSDTTIKYFIYGRRHDFQDLLKPKV